MKFDDFWPQDRPQNDPRQAQDGSKRFLKAFFFYVEFYGQFWSGLGSILDPSLEPFGLQNRSKIHAKIFQKSSCANIPPRDRPKRPQERPKTPPRGPKRARRDPKSAPRGPKSAPRGPKSAPRDFKNISKSPKEHLRIQKGTASDLNEAKQRLDGNWIKIHMTVHLIGHDVCWDSKPLNLHASEPPSLRLPAAKCLGGIRGAITII